MDETTRKQPVKEVAALKYNPATDDVPTIVAIGHGHMADKILERAQEHDIPVVQDAGLAQLLSKLSVGDEIPPEVYKVVAQILLFVSGMDTSYGDKIKLRAKDSGY